MKKFILFALFCVSILLLMPMVSSIESDLLRNEIEKTYYKDMENLVINFDLIKINNLLIIIKILIFLEIGFDLSLLIYSLINDSYMFFAYFFKYLLIGLIIFPNTIIKFFDSIFRGETEDFIYITQLYIIGVLILFFIEINPTYLNYLFGLITYGFILNFSQIYRFEY